MGTETEHPAENIERMAKALEQYIYDKYAIDIQNVLVDAIWQSILEKQSAIKTAWDQDKDP